MWCKEKSLQSSVQWFVGKVHTSLVIITESLLISFVNCCFWYITWPPRFVSLSTRAVILELAPQLLMWHPAPQEHHHTGIAFQGLEVLVIQCHQSQQGSYQFPQAPLYGHPLQEMGHIPPASSGYIFDLGASMGGESFGESLLGGTHYGRRYVRRMENHLACPKAVCCSCKGYERTPTQEP